jgi:hypothetical protein
VIGAALALLLALIGALTTASAATSGSIVLNKDGDFAGTVRFNSGMHYFHAHEKEGPGVNSFQVLDWCGDGQVVGVVWRDGDGVHTAVPEEKDCTGGLLPYRYSAVPTGYAPKEMEEMSWWVISQDADGNVRYVGDPVTDWMGSYSFEENSDKFAHSSVYMDYYTEDEKGITVSLIPSMEAYLLNGDQATDAMWAALDLRTPLPDDLTPDQLDSLKKQLWCHAEYATPETEEGWGFGGKSWDLEADRPNVSWDVVKQRIRDHQCNWGEGGYPYYYYPPSDGEEDAPEDLAPLVDAGPDRKGTEGAAVTLDGKVWDDGGQATARWSYVPVKGVDDGASCSFADASRTDTGFTCTDDGTYKVTLTADDGVNSPVRDSALVTLENVAPTLSLDGPKEWGVHRVGDTVKLTASFTDPGSNDIHVCEVTWDDGTKSEFPAKDGGCAAERAYDQAGMNTIDVKVTDDDGGSDAAQTMIVVYDPRAGLLTATGATGELGFSAVAKYPFISSTAPLGSVTLTVPVDNGKLTLVSTELEWLVITPEGRAAVKGSTAEYGFLGYAQAGKFRGVIWPLSEGVTSPNTPLYDSLPGGDWDLDRADPPPVTAGVSVIDTGWIPGLPSLPLLPGLLSVAP